MKLSVAKLFGPEFTGLDVEQRLSFDGDLGARYPNGAGLTALVRKISHGVHMTGLLSGRERETCARCLEPFDRVVNVAVDETFSEDVPESEALLSDVAPLVGREIDLTELAAQLLEADEPIAAVCDERCKGICAKCGQNLNVARCACVDDAVDPRLAGLARLLEERRDP